MYSFSQILLYEQCPKKYQFKYINNYGSEFVASYDIILGNSVHETLQWLYKEVNVFKLPSEDEVLSKFREIRDKKVSVEGEIKNKGSDSIDDYLRRGRLYLEEYYDKNSPFDGIKIIGTELRLNFNVKKNGEVGEGRQFRGAVDRLDKQGDDIFVINDYKTNKNLSPNEKEHYKEQLTLYALGVKKKYGEYFKTIKARLYYLHFSIVDEREITEDILNPVIEKYSNLVDEIEKKKEAYVENPDRSIFSTNANPLCQFCEFHNICPLFAHLNIEDEKIDGGILGESTLKKLVDRFYKLSKDATEITKQKDMIKELLIEYADAKGFEQLFGEEDQVKISKSINYSIKDKQALKQYLIENGFFNDVAEVPRQRVNGLVEDGKVEEEKAKEFLEPKNSWRVTASKRKDVKEEE